MGYIFFLALSRQRSLSYRNKSIDFHRKSMDWFLYDRDLRNERVNPIDNSSNQFTPRRLQEISIITKCSEAYFEPLHYTKK